MKDTKKESSQSRPQLIVKEQGKSTQPLASSPSHVKSNADTKTSPSLSMNVAEHLLWLMKEVTKESVSPQSVNAACNCATQMINLMKLNMKLRDM